MSKLKLGISTALMLLVFSLFSMVAFAEAPATPKVTSKLVAPDSLVISWEAVEDADHYNLYWGFGKVQESVDGTSVTKTVDGNYVPFEVTAVNAAGEESAPFSGDQAFMHSANIKNDGSEGTHKVHGDFQNNTNGCANCHSTHNGENAKLLKYTSSEYDLCLSCHDGTLGFYNVLGEGSGAGTFDDSHMSASMHDVNAGVSVGTAPGALVNQSEDEMQCSSCHNPHGTVNDRLLKFEGDAPIKLDVDPDPEYAALNESTGPNGVKIVISSGPEDSDSKENYAGFCGTCHDDYLKSRTEGRADGHYTHTANSSSQGRGCASCHYAHGTDVRLMKDAVGKTVADYVAEGWSQDQAEGYMQDVTGNSNLKKFTNMAVCFACHTSSHSEGLVGHGPAEEGGDWDGPMPEQDGDPWAGTGEYWNWSFSSRHGWVPTMNGKAEIN